MVLSIDEFRGLAIHATDGDIGRVCDLYFDDHRWTIRYLVIDTRLWLPGRRILLSPASVRDVDWAHREIVVALGRDQIRRSPGVDSDRPVGPERIALARECYTLPYAWALGGFLWAPAPSARRPRQARRRPGDPYLRSARLLRGYGLKALDGDVGHLDGFLVDDSSWSLPYVVVNTRRWPPASRVLVPVAWIAWVSWIELAVHVDLPVEQILSAPDYDPSEPVTDADETRLSTYYGRPTRRRRDVRTA
jgi:hypothetical protein